MHEVLVNRLGGLSLPRKSVVRLTDRPDMTLDVYRGRKTTKQKTKKKKKKQRKTQCISMRPYSIIHIQSLDGNHKNNFFKHLSFFFCCMSLFPIYFASNMIQNMHINPYFIIKHLGLSKFHSDLCLTCLPLVEYFVWNSSFICES